MRYLPSIALATAAAVTLALLYLASATPLYTASTTLFIDPRSRKIVAEEVVQGGLGSDFALVESQVNIIGSDAVLGRVVDTLNLVEDPDFASASAQSGLIAEIKALIRGRQQPAEPRIQALEALARSLKVKRAQKTYVVEIEVTATSPAKAARLTNAIVDAYIADQTTAKTDEARKANTLIDSRLGELREQVRKAETRVDEFKKANRILTSEGGIVTEQQLGKLNAELITSRAVAAESKARLEQATAALRNGNPDTLPEAMKSGVVQKLRDNHSQIARRQAALSSQLRDKHPVLIEVRSQLSELKGQIATELKRIAAAAKSDYQIAAAREREITNALERMKEEVSRTNTAQIKLRELEQEVNTSRELLRQFLARAKETEEEQKITTSEARIISPAAVPTHPSRPVPWLVLALGALGGLGLGVARALSLDHFDPSVRSLGEASGAAGTDPIAAIPALKPSLLSSWIPSQLRPPTLDAAHFSDLMSAIGDARSTRAPAYRQAVLRLLNRILAKGHAGVPTTALFMASDPGAGTSATALAVAYAAALAGEKVLLVDAASSNAELSTMFAAGLGDGEVVVLDNKDDLARIVTQDARSGLSFLPIALADLRMMKTSQRRRLATGLTALAKDYTLMIIDAGALLEDESGASLVPAAQQVLLVAKERTTSRQSIAEAMHLLEQTNVAVDGLVLNMARSAAV
jgi:uncharacterized protein involved in exopolysaccharide biosynthesis/Mrp family chromosome partitioning ATPase